ncbi:MAG: GAF domain-containing protein [Anaerolineae bacterium]|nr:GAF domain-containing protein [Anaerolineae bacterium]
MKKQISTQETAGTMSRMLPWRQALFERILRVVAIVALPLLMVGGYYIYTTGQMWLLALVLFGYVGVAVSAFAPRIPYVWRVWALLSALLILGISDLLTYGWGEDGRIYLMTATLFATLFLGGRHSMVMLVVSALLLTLFVVMTSLGIIVPLQPEAGYTSAALVSGLIVFLVCTTALFAAFNNLLPRVFDSLQRSAQLSADLEARQHDLAERMRVLQDSNLSLQRHAMYMDAGVQVTRDLMQQYDVESLLEQTVQLISRHFDFPHVAIFLPDETGARLMLRAASSPEGRKLAAKGYRLKRTGESALRRVFETRQSYIARSNGGTTVDADLDAAHLAQRGLPAAQSAALLPLVMADEALGVLDIHSAEETTFDQDNLRVLEGLAWQVAVALDNARRLSAGDSVLEKANPFFRLTQRLGRAHTVAEAHTAILELAEGLHPGRVYIVQMAKGARDTAYLVTDLREAALNVQRVDEGDAAENFSAALMLGMVLEKPLFIPDVGAPPDLPETGCTDLCQRLVEDTAFGGSSRSVALIPLRAGAEFYGLVMVGFDGVHRLTTLEMQIYRAIGEFGGVTLERIALLDEVQTRLAQEQWLREFGERVLQTPDLEAMLAQATQSLRDIAYADGVVAAVTLPEALS